VYTQAWIDFLVIEIGEPQRYALLTGGPTPAAAVPAPANEPQALGGAPNAAP